MMSTDGWSLSELFCSSSRNNRSECFVDTSVNQNRFLKQILASSCGSVVATLTLNPITVVKVRLQNASVVQSTNSLSVFNVVRNIALEHGPKGFWSGTPMGILMSVPNTVLYMSAYEELKIALPNIIPNVLSGVTPAVAGGLARAVSVTVISPLEMIRTIQTGGVDQSITNIAKKIVREGGLRGLYRGWAPSIMRDCPFSAAYWFGFETFRPIYTDLIQPHNCNNSYKSVPQLSSSLPYSPFVTFLSGATSSMLAAIMTHPFDVLKTQQQVSAWNKTISTSSDNVGTACVKQCCVTSCCERVLGPTHAQSSSVCAANSSGTLTIPNPLAAVQRLYSNGGVTAMYRGLSMRLVTVIPASAIMVTIYEAVKAI